MKRGTPRHPKLADLSARLKVPRYSAAGILELLWHFTAEFAPAGDIGKFSDEAICSAVGWDHASQMLVSSLLDARWLDACPCHRLRIHDWPDHADQTVQRVLHKRHQDFIPCYDDPSTMLAPCQHETSQPSPSPSPSPSPEPSPPAARSYGNPPTLEEVIAFGAQWPGDIHRAIPRTIPAELCEKFHHHRTLNKKWFLPSGELIDWRYDLVHWWTTEHREWKEKHPKEHPPGTKLWRGLTEEEVLREAQQ